MDIKLKVRWSNYVKILTIIIGIILVASLIVLIKALRFLLPAWNLASYGFVALIMIVVFVFIYVLVECPVSVELTDKQIILNKIIGKIYFNYSDIESIEKFKPSKAELRLWGSGGFMGFIGIFSNPQIGKYHSYVGCYAQAFCIKTVRNKFYVLSCENRELVINTVRENKKENPC